MPLGENENFIADLIDMEVVTDEGKALGTLIDVMETGANDVYVVETSDGEEILLPAIRDCILDVNVEEKLHDGSCAGGIAGLMNFHVLTLFPDMIRDGFQTSITGRAVEKGLLSLDTVNIRDFSVNKHNRVDDYPYGGGAGMVMQAEPVYLAYQSVAEKLPKKPKVLYMSPQGKVFNQRMAEELAQEEEIVFLCGHYEGIDERVLEEIVDEEVSIGDYVLTGGELPALVIMDAVSRLVGGVLHNEDSAEFDSFHDNLLEYPQYSRPEVWRDKAVPPILMSGHHANVEKWRREQSLIRTLEPKTGFAGKRKSYKTR